ncbi:hypothetical protein HEK616_34020 [Streptomyces nigrescens]|uniref:Uncharacterized protein n=1 Tax=Streptomyces nigrescens TaxID=1920 RepID=A0ABM7ZU72_STRNI|nr:hypothetical protein HEK616_34020 [Streptomyces nigrescens]
MITTKRPALALSSCREAALHEQDRTRNRPRWGRSGFSGAPAVVGQEIRDDGEFVEEAAGFSSVGMAGFEEAEDLVGAAVAYVVALTAAVSTKGNDRRPWSRWPLGGTSGSQRDRGGRAAVRAARKAPSVRPWP